MLGPLFLCRARWNWWERARLARWKKSLRSGLLITHFIRIDKQFFYSKPPGSQSIDLYTVNKLKWGKVKAEHYKTTRVSHFIFCSDKKNYLTFYMSQSRCQWLKYFRCYTKINEKSKNESLLKMAFRPDFLKICTWCFFTLSSTKSQ